MFVDLMSLNEGGIGYMTSTSRSLQKRRYHVPSIPRQTTLFELTVQDKHLCVRECIAATSSSPYRRGASSCVAHSIEDVLGSLGRPEQEVCGVRLRIDPGG
ncbi:hypothetical protein K443DRAFT_401919 [Laccaria amethystina LaAM-08-1]|uniref:Uncharacterized protein n=1 Tax=Laccaria amethystina LaAM-08-1 TaxID=1095629 RepID=A0A0C9WX31_9AGAR|nr:hypothetical protein K443DRAFT_401919 [Laccaria amethystina LaAM-08-1]